MKLIIILICLFTGLNSFSQRFAPDTAVNKIALKDSTTVLHMLGKDCWNALRETSEIPKIIVYSQNQNERLELIFHEGDNRNCFSEFRVLSNLKDKEKNDHKGLIIKEDHFESSKGIKLGLDSKTVEEKLGFKLNRRQSKSGELILSFRKEILNDPAFIRYYMPVYYGNYIFRRNRLVEFTFGFEEL